MFEVTFQKNGMGTDCFGLHQGHAGMYAERPRFITGGMYDAPLIFRASDNHRPVPQQGIKTLLNGGEKRIGVYVHD